MLLGLAGAAGYVDAVGYLAFGHIFVANMTGNSVLLAIAAVSGDGDALLRSVFALTGFVAGAAIGAALTEARGEDGPARPGVPAALAVEGALLAVVAVGWAATHPAAGAALWTCIMVTAIAMGVQSAAARRLAVPGVSTVVLTGTLTLLVARVVARVCRWPQPAVPGPAAARGPGILLGVWAAYVVGAALGAWIAGAGVRWVLLPPAVVVVASALGARRTARRP